MGGIRGPGCCDCTAKTRPSADVWGRRRGPGLPLERYRSASRTAPRGVAASRFAQLALRRRAADRLVEALQGLLLDQRCATSVALHGKLRVRPARRCRALGFRFTVA